MIIDYWDERGDGVGVVERKCGKDVCMSCKVRVILLLVMFGLVFGCDKDKDSVSEEENSIKNFSEETRQMDAGSKRVKLATSMGDIVIELNEEAAPVTVKNFVRYTEEGFYDGTIFHRVIPGFMIQGGGFGADMVKKPTHESIVNEASNGLKNDRGTIVMARMDDPDSASSQFFINHNDNDALNYSGQNNPGYAVFGKVVEGMDVVDKIAAVQTGNKGQYGDVPVKAVVIESAEVVSDK